MKLNYVTIYCIYNKYNEIYVMNESDARVSSTFSCLSIYLPTNVVLCCVAFVPVRGADRFACCIRTHARKSNIFVLASLRRYVVLILAMLRIFVLGSPFHNSSSDIVIGSNFSCNSFGLGYNVGVSCYYHLVLVLVLYRQHDGDSDWPRHAIGAKVVSLPVALRCVRSRPRCRSAVLLLYRYQRRR